MKKISPARVAAARVLIAVDSDTYIQANEALTRISVEMNLKPEDLRLARTLAFGVLRHAITLDYYYAPLLKKRPDKLDHRFRLCLRLASFQIIMLDRLPDYAVVNETVELARGLFKMNDQQTGFLNAVLRKLLSAEELPSLPTGNRVPDLAIRYSFPAAMTGLLVNRYGTHKAIDIMEASNVEPAMTIRVNVLKTDVETLDKVFVRAGFGVERGLLCPEALTIVSQPAGTSIFTLPEFAAGHFYIQDEASQLVAHLVNPVAGERILDMCSAPGGKTTHLAELSKGTAAITSTDLSEIRLSLVTENVNRLQTPGINIVKQPDVLDQREQFDVALVDAPCSGAGTVRRNPEIRYRINEESLVQHSKRQIEVLNQTAPLVRDGGRLIYSTCSISHHENRDVIRKFLKANSNWEVATSPVSEVVEPLHDEDHFYRTWPRFPQLDGFEAVVLHKIQSDLP